ncbi:MAG: hypothetical protein AAFY56_23035, partial [Pseudomonadota bacterium]
MNECLWKPEPARAAATAIGRLAEAQGFSGQTAIQDLWQWTVDHPEAFWRTVWQECDIRASGD